jgi:hypothetical protein
MKGRVVLRWIGLGEHVERPESGQGNNEQKTKAFAVVRQDLHGHDFFRRGNETRVRGKYIPKINGARGEILRTLS